MGRPKKDGSLCRITTAHSLEEKKEILDQYCLMRKVNDLTQAQICEKLEISPQILYQWIKDPKLKGYDKKFKDATKIGEFNSSDEVLVLAKNQLRKLLTGYKSTESTRQYKYENGKKILVNEYIKEKVVEPDFEQIKFILEKLSPTFSDNSTKNVLGVFMNFNEFLKEINPTLAQQISVLQNNYLAQSIKEIDEIK